MWRFSVPAVCIVVAFVLVQMQVANLMVLPGQPGALPNGQPRTWMLLPLPKNPKLDPQARAEQRAKKKIEEQVSLLRPFAQPYPFEDAERGYKVIFPGKPTMPMYRMITGKGTTWYYEEQRLGKITFSATWDKEKKLSDGQSDRELLDWSKKHYQKEMERIHGDDKRWIETDQYFKFQNKYEAADVVDYYHFKNDDDYYGQQMCRRRFILVGQDLYGLAVEGNAEVVSSKLADEFFKSFELIPKVAKK
jgi:hypothetical protein